MNLRNMLSCILTLGGCAQMVDSSHNQVHSLIRERHSARAMSGEKISTDELMTLFKAAGLAQSSYNDQPWRFIYAERETPHWQPMLDLLVPFNQSWAAKGAVLIAVISHNNFEHNNQFSRTHSFDTGAAMENLALQGISMGFIVHGMAGFDYDKARTVLNVPDDYTVEAMFVVGKPGNVKDLPAELQSHEKRSERKDVKDLISEGTFKIKK